MVDLNVVPTSTRYWKPSLEEIFPTLPLHIHLQAVPIAIQIQMALLTIILRRVVSPMNQTSLLLAVQTGIRTTMVTGHLVAVKTICPFLVEGLHILHIFNVVKWHTEGRHQAIAYRLLATTTISRPPLHLRQKMSLFRQLQSRQK